jgi:hypothetical protein
MATKQELQLTMKTFGYELNPYTSKETLVNLMRLHSKVRDIKEKKFEERHPFLFSGT